MAQPMGIGKIGLPGTIVRRKHRFTMQINHTLGTIPEHYVQIAGRPKLSLEATEVAFLNAITWLPSRVRWEPITVRYIDVADPDMAPLYNWIATLYDFQNPSELYQSEKVGWNANAVIKEYDGCGVELQRWTLSSCFPESVDFGDLSMEEEGFSTIELVLRYSEVKQEGKCNTPTAKATSLGCGLAT